MKRVRQEVLNVETTMDHTHHAAQVLANLEQWLDILMLQIVHDLQLQTTKACNPRFTDPLLTQRP